MKQKLFKYIIRLMYRNLSKGEYGCPHCKESAREIMRRLDKRERVLIAFNPDFNTSGTFMSYHISDVTMKYPH
jgi:hypothetical protein